MHPSVMDFLRRVLRPEEVEGRDVLEVGSQDVNGSPREVVLPMRPLRYVGVDFAPGKGVDVVLDVQKEEFYRYFYPKWFDVVISTEMLEHVGDWRAAVVNMLSVVRPGGLLVVTTRGPGFPYHGYPHDYWRFTVENFRSIFSDMEILTLEPDVPGFPGVLFKARRTDAPILVDHLREIEVARIS